MNTYLWIAVLFGITIVMYLMGYSPLFFDQMSKYNSVDYTTIASVIGTYLTSWDGILTIGGAVVVGALLSGLNLLALIPFVLANLILNLFVFPTSYITQSGLPSEISLLITSFFAVTTYLVWISFVRQGT